MQNVTTIFIADNEEKVKQIITQMLSQCGDTNLEISRQENFIKIIKKDGPIGTISLKDKVIELEESLYKEKKGVLYKSILAIIEKPIFEHILEQTDGNQFKAARILGINRNTMRNKIKKFGINLQAYKQ